VIALPFTVPVRGRVPDVDKLIVPLSLPDDSVHVSAKVPVKAPLYDPDHLPVRAPAGAAVGDEALGVDAGVVATVGVVTALVDDDAAGDDEADVPDPLLHPDARTAGSSSAAASRGRRARVRMTAVMSLPFGLARRRSPPSIRSTGAGRYWRIVEACRGGSQEQQTPHWCGGARRRSKSDQPDSGPALTGTRACPLPAGRHRP